MILNIGQTLTAFQWPTDASANPFKPPETISVIFIMKVRSNFPWGGAVPSGTVHQRWLHTNYTNQICLDQGLHQWQILINAVQLECCTWLTIYLEQSSSLWDWPQLWHWRWKPLTSSLFCWDFIGFSPTNICIVYPM